MTERAVTEQDLTDEAVPSDLELGALMCSRLCHDIISPVGAIANGFEVLDDEKDESMRQMALDIIRNNADKASARLQFARLAFGAMGAAGDRFPLEDARRLTENLYKGEKARIQWDLPPAALPKDQVKLLVNLVMVAVATIPRGGEVSVGMAADGDRVTFSLAATGINASIPETARQVFGGRVPHGRLDAHSIQPYYTYRLARSIGMDVRLEPGDGIVRIEAGPAA
ncbi:histidine phosphotransferase ChpT [Tepidamorphus gemmatus]|uniref:Histidine phosphotransferase ChpT n=1 Tax=Tepidamorphus gemmatus TaxID=747076 RepID=A0A4V2V005_9HYPH|nr:histidine phosphotransferase family protein [Tepidamorphus gemmatus]TCT13389.1 histidine phosphotransferase ChpT [Tepidamorphus gemmatus]